MAKKVVHITQNRPQNMSIAQKIGSRGQKKGPEKIIVIIYWRNPIIVNAFLDFFPRSELNIYIVLANWFLPEKFILHAI
jgi:hypothetical protein